MNKYSKLNKLEFLEICKIIHPDAEWEFHQVLDNDGKGSDDCYEFLGNDGSMMQFNIHRSEYDELRFYKHYADGKLFEIGEETLKFSEDKIDNYLHSLINKSQDTENKNSLEELSNSKEEEIKSFFLHGGERDEFTKSQKYCSRIIILDYENYVSDVHMIYKKKSNEDIFILMIGHVEPTPEAIIFLFEDNETIKVDKVIKHKIGELYLQTDIYLLIKIINSKKIKLRVENTDNILTETKLTFTDKINLIGFYNALFDNTFMKDELISFLEKEKKKRIDFQKIKENKNKKDKAKKETKEQKETKETKSSSQCFVVTATMNDPDHPIVNDFRLYRDRYLLNSKAGFNFVKFYYQIGPYFASLINKSETLRKISFNSFIKPIHKLIQKKIDTNNN
ncbi:CFI-box-CTERM domain-containing protein [Siansivirga zeaxanthinifaciens]|uniref:Uncharacterized protein n=1 Tax=Siansivirga zeaxanthinifaciens CC-SAMT-1 TaxID=1454006 RepID=A0A0C5WHQ4_9FLAO|nr:CFI-box-CTERM domain-containing protein [Siansivirga zeaxanthinifaciens]AJR04689.1 hypothetical protein AW14_00040 [Siansivirga zeaxanthinifaciens CC-SAMT-1]